MSLLFLYEASLVGIRARVSIRRDERFRNVVFLTTERNPDPFRNPRAFGVVLVSAVAPYNAMATARTKLARAERREGRR